MSVLPPMARRRVGATTSWRKTGKIGSSLCFYSISFHDRPVLRVLLKTPTPALSTIWSILMVRARLRAEFLAKIEGKGLKCDVDKTKHQELEKLEEMAMPLVLAPGCFGGWHGRSQAHLSCLACVLHGGHEGLVFVLGSALTSWTFLLKTLFKSKTRLFRIQKIQWRHSPSSNDVIHINGVFVPFTSFYSRNVGLPFFNFACRRQKCKQVIDRVFLDPETSVSFCLKTLVYLIVIYIKKQ